METATDLSLIGVVPAGSPLDGIAHGAVKAIVSPFDAADIEDPQRLERHVRAHVEALLAAGPVVPIRFGTLFGRREDVEAWLERNEAPLVEQLASLAGAVEWSVKIAQRAQPELVGAGSYLERRLAAGEEAGRRSEELRAWTEQWHEQLAAVSLRAARTDAFDAAYLVPGERQSAFDATITRLYASLPRDLDIRITGPWPPYTFVPETLA